MQGKHVVGELLPHCVLGAFDAVMFGAVMTGYNATLNSCTWREAFAILRS